MNVTVMTLRKLRHGGTEVSAGFTTDGQARMTLEELLRHKRVAAKLTQESAASRSGVAAATWSRTETGRFKPSASLLAQMAAAVTIKPEELENFGEDAAADILRSQQSPGGAQDDQVRRMVADLIADVPVGYSVRTWRTERGSTMLEIARLTDADLQDAEDVEADQTGRLAVG